MDPFEPRNQPNLLQRLNGISVFEIGGEDEAARTFRRSLLPRVGLPDIKLHSPAESTKNDESKQTENTAMWDQVGIVWLCADSN